jgi:hypothetical protein
MTVPNTFTPGTLISAAQVNENFSAVVSEAELAAASGATRVGFTEYGTGAVTRSVEARLRDSISVKDFGAVGNGVADDTAAFNRAVAANQAVVGGDISIPTPGTYKLTSQIKSDPVRTGFVSSGATLDFSGMNFPDPSDSPELIFNPNINGSTGWLIGDGAGTVNAFNSGAAKFTAPRGVEMLVASPHSLAPANSSRYLEFGQRITANVGDLVRVEITVDWVKNVEYTNPPAAPTTQSRGFLFFGGAEGADGSSRDLTDMAVIAVPSLSFSSTEFVGENPAPKTYTLDFTVPLGPPPTLTTPGNLDQFVNPYVRISSNASMRVSRVSAKVIPRNAAFYITSTIEQYGHPMRQWGGFRIRGPAVDTNTVQADRATAFLLASDPPQSTRIHMQGVQIIGATFKYGIDMGDGAYLCSFTDCFISGRVAGFHSQEKAFDAGENINFRGGVITSLGGVAYWNEGNFQLNAFGTSSDFPYQFFKGTGQNRFFGCHWEKNGFQGQEDRNLPLVELTGGQLDYVYGRIQINQSYFVTTLAAPLYVSSPGVATFTGVNMSNMECTQDVLSVGGGKVSCRGTVGGSNIPTIVHRNYEDNAAGDGRFARRVLSPDSWVSSNGNGLQANDASLSLIAPTALASTYTVTVADRGKAFAISAANPSSTVTLPSAVTVGAGYYVVFKNEAYVNATPSIITVNTVSGQTIDGKTEDNNPVPLTIPVLGVYSGSNPGNIRTLISNGSNWITPDARLRNTQYSIDFAYNYTAQLYAFTGILPRSTSLTTNNELTSTTQVQFTGQGIGGYRIYGAGLNENTSVIASQLPTSNNNGTVDISSPVFRPGSAATVQSFTIYNPTPNGTGTVEFDPTVYRTDYNGVAGYGSAKVTKGSGVRSADAFYFNQIIPLQVGCGIGFESFIKLEPVGGDADNVLRNVYVRKFWVRSTDRDSYNVPILEVDEDLNSEDVIQFQSSTGKRVWSFAANTTSGSPILTNLTGGLFAPFNKLQVGDAIVGAGIPANAVLKEKLAARPIDPVTDKPIPNGPIIYTFVLALNSVEGAPANATATATDVSLTAYAADLWVRTSYSNLNAPTPVVRPDWATHLRVRYDISGLTGPRSIWVTDTMATPW